MIKKSQRKKSGRINAGGYNLGRDREGSEVKHPLSLICSA